MARRVEVVTVSAGILSVVRARVIISHQYLYPFTVISLLLIFAASFAHIKHEIDELISFAVIPLGPFVSILGLDKKEVISPEYLP